MPSRSPVRPLRAPADLRLARLTLCVAATLCSPLALAQQAAPSQPAAAPETPVTLSAVEVRGAQDETTEGKDSYVPSATSAATGLPLTLRETPQTVQVITRQQLDDENIETIGDVFEAATGVTFTELDNGARTTYRARGFAISNYKVDGAEIDGGSGFSGAGSSLNLDLYDRVTLVRGANGLLGGNGDPSATVDLARKRPGRDFAASAAVRVGSWNKRQLMGDLNVPITDDGRIRSRVVVSGEDSDGFRDHENLRRLGVLASVEADLTADTRVGVGYQQERSKTRGASWGANVPVWFADGSPTSFSRSFNPVTDWSYTERDGRTVFVSLEQQLSQGWDVKLNAAHTWSEAINNMGIVKVNTAGGRWPHWSQDGSGAYLNGIHSESEGRLTTFSAAVSGPISLFGREHDLMFGFNGSRNRSTSYTFNRGLGNCALSSGEVPGSGCQFRLDLPVTDWREWYGDAYGDFETFRTDARSVNHTKQYGAYASGRFRITEPFSVILGVRRSRYEAYTQPYSVAGVAGARTGEQTQDVWTPYAGAVYDINRWLSAYGSYTDVFKPQTQRDAGGNVIEPIRGASYEAGFKGDWFDGALYGSLSGFYNKQMNVAQTDGANLTPDGAQAYVAKGSGVRSRGADLELVGQLAAGWNVALGYTYLSVQDDNTAERPDPRHLVRLNTTYRLPGQWSKLTVGGGVSMQSYTVSAPYPGRPTGNGTFDDSPIRLGGYALFNAMARYEINRNLTATLNVTNLFDKTYYRQYGFYNGLIYGEPRRITVGLRVTY